MPPPTTSPNWYRKRDAAAAGASLSPSEPAPPAVDAYDDDLVPGRGVPADAPGPPRHARAAVRRPARRRWSGCRVLELGCGDGGNLIPMAYALPEAPSFVGLDLNAAAVAAAARESRGAGARRTCGSTSATSRRSTRGRSGASTTSSRTACTRGCPSTSAAALLALCRACLERDGSRVRELQRAAGRPPPAGAARRRCAGRCATSPSRGARGSRRRGRRCAGWPRREQYDGALGRELRADARRPRTASIYHDVLAGDERRQSITEFAGQAAARGAAPTCATRSCTTAIDGVARRRTSARAATASPASRSSTCSTLRMFRQALLVRDDAHAGDAAPDPRRRSPALHVRSRLRPPRKRAPRRDARSTSSAGPSGGSLRIDHPLVEGRAARARRGLAGLAAVRAARGRGRRAAARRPRDDATLGDRTARGLSPPRGRAARLGRRRSPPSPASVRSPRRSPAARPPRASTVGDAAPRDRAARGRRAAGGC